MTVEEFIKKAWYEYESQRIYGIDEKGGMQLILEVRGWGAIQNLYKTSGNKYDTEAAAKFQDSLGEWITDAINEKLKGPNEGFPM